MARGLLRGMMLLAVLALLSAPRPARAGETSDEFDARITRDLEQQNPAAADLFREAGKARAADDHARAADLYRRVFEMAPGYVHALRRQGQEELALEHRQKAIELLRQALGMDLSVENRSSLATALSTSAGGSRPSDADLKEATGLIEPALAEKPQDMYVLTTASRVALLTGNVDLLSRGVAGLEAVAPDEAVTSYTKTFLLLMQGDLSGAETALDKARQRGLPEDAYQSLHKLLRERRPWPLRVWKDGRWILVAWLAGFLFFFLAGWLLSGITLRLARQLPSESSGRARGLDAMVRRLYALVLWCCCAYYYLSIPLVVLVVLGLGGGIIYALLAAHYVPIKLVVIVLVLVVVTIWALIKSLFVRGRGGDPGLKLEPGQHPRLRAVLDDVAARVGTRSVDNVYLTPGTEVAVMERGGLWKQLRGASERCLILGIGVLEGMTLRPFRSVLAHEYGHFSNRDTAGGGFALAVRRSLFNTALSLAQGGAAAWYNPAWLFVVGFHRLFLRISQGASRLQEILADRWAAFTYGSQAFVKGLRHVIERSLRFDAQVQASLKEVVEKRLPLRNLYTYQPAEAAPEEEIERAIDETMNKTPSAYDSHPRPADRLDWVEALNAPGGSPEADDDDGAWSLFEDRQAVEMMWTNRIRDSLSRDSGIQLPEEAT